MAKDKAMTTRLVRRYMDLEKRLQERKDRVFGVPVGHEAVGNRETRAAIRRAAQGDQDAWEKVQQLVQQGANPQAVYREIAVVLQEIAGEQGNAE